MKSIKFIFLFCSIFVFSQKEIKNGKVVYDIFFTEKIDKTKYSPEVYKIINYYTTKVEKCELVFNENESVFNIIKRALKPNEPPLKSFYNFTKTRGVHYYNKETKEKLLAKESFGQKIILDLSNENIVWNITKESKNINGYKCYSANAEMLKIANTKKNSKTKVRAWFCPEIPLIFGPLKYNGLPGLILEVEYDSPHKTKLVASEIIFNDNSIKPKKELKGKRMTVVEYEKLAQKILDERKSFF